jgi:hypothetical protein
MTEPLATTEEYTAESTPIPSGGEEKKHFSASGEEKAQKRRQQEPTLTNAEPSFVSFNPDQVKKTRSSSKETKLGEQVGPPSAKADQFYVPKWWEKPASAAVVAVGVILVLIMLYAAYHGFKIIWHNPVLETAKTAKEWVSPTENPS